MSHGQPHSSSLPFRLLGKLGNKTRLYYEDKEFRTRN